MFPTQIETDRLTLERLCRENVATTELYRHMSDDAPDIEEITEYVQWDPHRTIKDTHDHLEEVEAEWDDRRRATYAIRPDESEDGAGELAGVTNLLVGWERRAAELGIWLRKPFWGRGYAGERAAALYELAFERLDLELVGAAHHVGNERSKRAIRRYVDAHGGQHDGILRNWIPNGEEVRDVNRYTVTREQYRERSA